MRIRNTWEQCHALADTDCNSIGSIYSDDWFYVICEEDSNVQKWHITDVTPIPF